MIIASAVLQGRVLAVSAEVLGGDSWWRHMVQCSAAQEGRSPALARASCSHRARPAPALYSVFSAQSSVDNSSTVVNTRRRYGRGRRQTGGHSRQDRQVWRPGTAAGAGDLVLVLVGVMINHANVARTFSVR